MACDICSKTGVALIDLLDRYQTEDIKQVCGDCLLQVNRKKRQMDRLASQMTKVHLIKFMRTMKRTFNLNQRTKQ